MPRNGPDIDALRTLGGNYLTVWEPDLRSGGDVKTSLYDAFVTQRDFDVNAYLGIRCGIAPKRDLRWREIGSTRPGPANRCSH